MWPKHIDLKNKINHCTEAAFWPPLPGHLGLQDSASPTLPPWKHMDFSPGRRFATYVGKQDGFSKEPKFANPSFPKAVSSLFTLRCRRIKFYCSVFWLLLCFCFCVCVCFFGGAGVGSYNATSTQGQFRGSCHMAQGSPGTSVYS